MKTVTLDLQFTINLGNFENVRIGGQWLAEGDETCVDLAPRARKELLQAFGTIYEYENGKLKAKH